METNPQAKSFYDSGSAACQRGQVPQAMELFRRAISLDPDNPILLNAIAGTLVNAGQLIAAEQVMADVVKRLPPHSQSYLNHGTILATLNRNDEAAFAWRKALELSPNLVGAELKLAKLEFNAGRSSLAVAHCKRALEIQPDHQGAISLMLYSMLFDDALSPEQITRGTVGWDDRFAPPASVIRDHTNERSADRKLRIGYLSPFFRGHVITMLFEPILAKHDREKFELYAYCTTAAHRTAQANLSSQFTRWRNCDRLGDDEMANTIRADGIDILVDLCSHMDQGRPATLARKPAPLQISYLAYPATIGLKAMDYRISCPALDPIGSEDAIAPEKLLRLPDTFWCYPTNLAPRIEETLPSNQNDFVTFGCLNSFIKVRPACIAAWARLLECVPGSKLMLLALDEAEAPRVRDRMARDGVDPNRVIALPFARREEHLSRFNRIDVSLDSFPIGGHTTTHDSLWMGVPVIAMKGDSAMSRAGECILPQVGLGDCLATSIDDYIRRATGLAADLDQRVALRNSLRVQMQSSPLCDAVRFTRNLEAGYRAVWRRWCAGQSPAHLDVAGD